ncbi:hypothetical protein [Kribbella sp. NPDC004536]
MEVGVEVGVEVAVVVDEGHSVLGEIWSFESVPYYAGLVVEGWLSYLA